MLLGKGRREPWTGRERMMTYPDEFLNHGGEAQKAGRALNSSSGPASFQFTLVF